ncbi:MAG: DNA polymerase III subunit beta [Deltaproteobacteria bacterium]|jgi:DNA polymerase-3 subunit beta|nr:DNA polymerase III subunit beta [Deltaproteobacteria bacterium]
MKFNIKKEIFLKALTKVQGIIEKKHTLPILANVLIEVSNDEIIVTATDLEVGIKSKYKAEVIEDGKITLSAKKLFEIIKELPDKNISFCSKSNFWVEIKCDKSIFNLVGLSPDEFPKFPIIDESKTIIDKNIINEMIEKTIFSISSDETKFNLTGIYIKQENKNLNFVSTDGHRLSLISKIIEGELNNKFLEGFILPKKGIIELKKLLENIEDNVSIGITENNFSISNKNTTLIMRMVDGEFPDYNRVIPEKGKNVATIDKNLFLHSLKRISVLSNEKSKGIKIKLENDLITLTSSNPDLGDAKEEINIIYKGDEISIGFNAKYIIDILQVIKDNNIYLYLKDNISPGRISPENDDNYLSVIMPMRL